MTGKQRDRLRDSMAAYGRPEVVLESRSGRHVVGIWLLDRPHNGGLVKAIRLIGPDGQAIPLQVARP